MFHTVFKFLQDELNAYINLKTSAADSVSITPVADAAGAFLFDKIGLTLINIQEDRSTQPLPEYHTNSVGTLTKSNPKTRVNLTLLLSANFENNYDEALKHIAFIITFFQARHVFSPQSHPALPDGLEKMVCEMQSLSLEQQNNMWAALGAKYRPSVVYKLRMLLLEDALPLGADIPIREIQENYQ